MDRALRELREYQQHIKDYKCRDCTHKRRNDNGTFYCNTRKSFYTPNLKLIIRISDVACPLYMTEPKYEMQPNDKF